MALVDIYAVTPPHASVGVSRASAAVLSFFPTSSTKPPMASKLPRELIRDVLKLLQDDKPSLRCCALIHPTWMALAQTYIFQTITLDNDMAWSRILTVLEGSPHLRKLVHRILIVRGNKTDTMPLLPVDAARIPNLLPCVEALSVTGVEIDTLLVEALQCLKQLSLKHCTVPYMSPVPSDEASTRPRGAPRIHTLRFENCMCTDTLDWLQRIGAVGCVAHAVYALPTLDRRDFERWLRFVAAEPALVTLESPLPPLHRNGDEMHQCLVASHVTRLRLETPAWHPSLSAPGLARYLLNATLPALTHLRVGYINTATFLATTEDVAILPTTLAARLQELVVNVVEDVTREDELRLRVVFGLARRPDVMQIARDDDPRPGLPPNTHLAVLVNST
jgi:hypothetical protein